MQPATARSSRAADLPLTILEGTLERITWATEDGSYVVARLSLPRQRDIATIVGPLAALKPGESLRLEGYWKDHDRYGRQFTVQRYATIMPATVHGIRRYLGSGLIRGLGPKTADRIVDHFGTDTLRILDEAPDQLTQLPGIGRKRAEAIAQAWQTQRQIKHIMLYLADVGVTPRLAARIYKAFGHRSADIVRTAPYRLANEIHGVGFKTADKVAQGAGIPKDDPERLKAGLRYALTEAAGDGHCCLPQHELIAKASQLLEADAPPITAALDQLTAIGVLCQRPNPDPAQPPLIYLPTYLDAEESLARTLRTLLRTPDDRLPYLHDPAHIAVLLAEPAYASLTDEQRAAITLALTHTVAILNGGPGTGKSHSIKTLVAIARRKGATVTLVAPTGRAAKRLSELADHPASTIHRQLQLQPGKAPAYGPGQPLPADLVVADEASMIDLLLADALVGAIRPGASLLLVGDADQLPAVGAGDVLRDLIASGRVPTAHLSHIFRQAARSGIVTNAHRINGGEHPITEGLDDFYFFPKNDPETAAQTVAALVAHKIPDKFGLHPTRDIQVLCPMHKGPAGTLALNTLLQSTLNPPAPHKPQRTYGDRIFRLGDKVVQLRNNYEKQVYNGTTATITAIDPEADTLTVRTDDEKDIVYDPDELDQLTLAYALSIHRSQGSEYPAVVIPLTTAAWIMLERNLLYTAVTRARKLVVLLGSTRAIAKAVATSPAGCRCTALAYRLNATP